MLDCGQRGDLLDLPVALAPCLIGYGEIAEWLLDQDTTEIENNPYADWIAMYSSDDFKEAVEAEREWLDARLSEVSERRLGELVDVFRDATRLEIDFWQMGLDRA